MAVLAALALVTGCENNVEREHREAEKARIEADQKRAEVQREADEKSREAERKAMEEKNEATEAWSKEKAEYREKVQKELTDLDKKIDDMRYSATRATGATKTEYERQLNDVQVRRDALNADLRRMDTVAHAEWNGLKESLDKSLDEFKKTVRTASSKIKTVPRREGDTTDHNLQKNNPAPTKTDAEKKTQDEVLKHPGAPANPKY
jgi:predicted RNase H-like nuclease (RuvC/YqgF family)